MILILRHLLYRDSILPVRRYLKTLNRLKNSLALDERRRREIEAPPRLSLLLLLIRVGSIAV